MVLDVLKRVENLLKSGYMMTNLEILVEEEKSFLGSIRPVSFGKCSVCVCVCVCV